mmetsp:Transcript_25190/g.54829  ORF Transcript_25190/g.54829 Transcript_25190/m.54829 type:complete len:553 (-) Transcript_25190:190-1848(-)|eukprot:CAMPEP_0118920952 /NCGR_PEP_ID=MMETSP1169-20130426/360_1 /TAXON_ID=36882 /ORGANISM="Pyramimonas obovata, Strain CCMP722" /LENGTH=552 /DNA_ID=CAMNT_0006861577 /DNA_START=273 /DNA_END=1931 /DNA_ORIENTATION=+
MVASTVFRHTSPCVGFQASASLKARDAIVSGRTVQITGRDDSLHRKATLRRRQRQVRLVRSVVLAEFSDTSTADPLPNAMSTPNIHANGAEAKSAHPTNQVSAVRKLRSLNLAETVQTLVLAGGAEPLQHSMFPLTLRRAKSAIPFGGSYRLIDIPLNNIIRSGLKQIYVLTQYNSRSLNAHIVDAYPATSTKSDVSVEVVADSQTTKRREWTKGSADAVRSILYDLPTMTTMPINPDKVKDMLVLSGEHLYSMDYSALIRQHRETDADITISTVGVSRTNKALYGVDGTGLGLVQLNDQRTLERFTEKPDITELVDHEGVSYGSTPELPFVASMGLYVFKADVLRELLAQPELMDFGRDVIPFALRNRLNVKGYVYKGYWEDISTLRSFLDANLRLASRNSPFKLLNTAPVTAPRILPPAKFIGECEVVQSLIAEGCVINSSHIRNAVLGTYTNVGPRSVVEGSIVMGADQCASDGGQESMPCAVSGVIGIGEGSVLRNCVVDKNVSIGKDCHIINKEQVQEGGSEAEGFFIRSGVVTILKEVVLPDGTII